MKRNMDILYFHSFRAFS